MRGAVHDGPVTMDFGPADADPRITEDVRKHILDGDGGSGGHRYTSTARGKTLFPERWTDSDAISALSQTLRNAYRTSDDHEHLADPNFLNLYGYVDGVRLVVRLRKADGPVKTALPLGSVRNVPLPHGLD